MTSPVLDSANRIIEYLKKYDGPDFSLVREIKWYLKKSPNAIALESLQNFISTFSLTSVEMSNDFNGPFTYTGTNISTTTPITIINEDFFPLGTIFGTGFYWTLDGIISTNINARYIYTNNSTGKTITSNWMDLGTTFFDTIKDPWVMLEGYNSLANVNSYPVPNLGNDFNITIQVIGSNASNSYDFNLVGSPLRFVGYSITN